MHAPPPYEFITRLEFTRLPLPASLSNLAACFANCLTLCGMDQSSGVHSLHLVSFLVWVLLRYGLFLL